MGHYREVTQQGWFARVGGSIKGMVSGLLLIALALGLQFWNEGRTVRRDAALAEGRAQVVSLTSATPDAAHEGALVHLQGIARADAPVQDAEFGVSLDALALRRHVEMYQWREKRDRREEKLVGGGTRTITEYRYEGHWNDEAVDSGRFEQRAGHENPGPLPYADHTWVAPQVRVGGFVLTDPVVRDIGGWDDVPNDRVQLPPNLAASFRAADPWLVTGEDDDTPQVGDLRVRFEMVPSGEVSVIARQQGTDVVPHTTASAQELLLVERGRVSATAMFDAAASNNSRTGWFLRFGGFVVAWIGFMLLLRPLRVFADVVPLLGRIASFGIAVVAALLSASVSVLAIGSGWLFHRPWLMALLFGAIAIAALWLWRARAKPSVVATMPPPPPPPA